MGTAAYSNLPVESKVPVVYSVQGRVRFAVDSVVVVVYCDGEDRVFRVR